MYTEKDIKHGFNPAHIKDRKRKDRIEIFIGSISFLAILYMLGTFGFMD